MQDVKTMRKHETEAIERLEASEEYQRTLELRKRRDMLQQAIRDCKACIDWAEDMMVACSEELDASEYALPDFEAERQIWEDGRDLKVWQLRSLTIEYNEVADQLGMPHAE